MLRTIVEDQIWVAEDDLFMPGGVHFPVRMTIVRLEDGTLWIHSPIKISDALAGELAALGEVKWLVAPNCFHHLYAGAAKERYPDAKLLAPGGLHKKRQDLSFDGVLSNKESHPWPAEFEVHKVGGVPGLQEVVFLHKATRTLIVTDLVFNIHETKNLRSVFVFKFIANAWKRVAQSNLIRFATKDKAAAGASAHTIMAWDFERLMMAHGQIVETDAKGELRKGLARMLSYGLAPLPATAGA